MENFELKAIKTWLTRKGFLSFNYQKEFIQEAYQKESYYES